MVVISVAGFGVILNCWSAKSIGLVLVKDTIKTAVLQDVVLPDPSNVAHQVIKTTGSEYSSTTVLRDTSVTKRRV